MDRLRRQPPDAIRKDTICFPLGGGGRPVRFTSPGHFGFHDMDVLPRNLPANDPQAEPEPARRVHEGWKKISRGQS